MTTLLSGLITSKTRIEILMRLFLNPDRRAHLRELAGELSVSPSQVKSELDNLSASGLLTSAPEGNRIQFGANPAHPLFPELQAMVRKALGMDRILDSILGRLGRLELALLVGDCALGRDSGRIDLVLVGAIDQRNLADLVAKTERQLSRKIRVEVLSPKDYPDRSPTLAAQPHLLLWAADGHTEAAALREKGAARQDRHSTTPPAASTLPALSAATSETRRPL
jgi:hypothetical protein